MLAHNIMVVAVIIREVGMTALQEPQGVFKHHPANVIASPSPGGHRTWITDVTIRGAQQLGCLQSPSPGVVVCAVEDTKVLVWAQALAGKASFYFALYSEPR